MSISAADRPTGTGPRPPLDGRPARAYARARRPGARPRRRGPVVRRALVAGDLLGLVAAFGIVQLVFHGGTGPHDRIDLVGESALFAATLPLWLAAARLYGLYDHDEGRADHSTVDDLTGVFHLVTVGAWLLFAGTWLSGLADPNLPKLVTFWALATGTVTVARAGARALCRRSTCYVQNTVIVGSGGVGRLLARKLRRHPEYGAELLGFVDGEPGALDPEGPPLIGTIEELPHLVDRYDLERVIVAFPNDSDDRTLQVVRMLRYSPVQVDVVPRLFELLSPNADIHTVEGLPVVGLRPFRLSRSARVLKRATDLAASTAALLLLGPLLAAIAVLIKLDSRGPALFTQVRMGMGEQPFRIYKFRTMVADADSLKPELAHLNMHRGAGGDPRMFKIPDDPRVTRAGRFLRRYSLDELPQLLNVVRGEMSLVGPRPLVLDEDTHVRHWGRRRLSFMPGITGPWQVLGASDIPFDEMINLDYLYVTEWSLFADFKWILRTVPAVFRVRNAY